jgi:hypothetical protein
MTRKQAGVTMSKDPGAQPLQNWVKSLDDLHREFEDSKSEIMALRLETKEESKERAKRERLGKATLRDKEEAPVARFASERHIDDLREYLSAAREAIPDLEAMFRAEVPTPAFLVTWGVFQLCYGLVMGSCSRSGDPFDTFRMQIRASAEKKTAAAKKRKFVAVLLKAKLDAGGTGKTIYEDVADQVLNYIATANLPPNFDEKWFRSLIDPTSKKLRATYNDRHLARAEIEVLAALPRGDIPSI